MHEQAYKVKTLRFKFFYRKHELDTQSHELINYFLILCPRLVYIDIPVMLSSNLTYEEIFYTISNDAQNVFVIQKNTPVKTADKGLFTFFDDCFLSND